MALTTRPRERVADATLQRWLEEYARRRDRGDAGRSRGDVPLETLRGQIADSLAPLVESVARRFLAAGEPVEDLVQEGYLGLLAALENWDPTRGVKFSTYAVHFINGAIRHFLRDRCRPIREPARVHALARRINAASTHLVHSLERTPRSDEIAQALELPVDVVDDILAVRERSNTTTIAEADPAGDTPDDALPLQSVVEDRVLLERALGALKVREQQVFYEFYYRDLSQIEIARKIGVSANYVSVILRRGTDRLRRLFLEAEVRDREWDSAGQVVDAETGLYGREQTYARLVEGISRAARDGEPFGVVRVRLDGLPESSRPRREALEACGAALRRSIRRADIGGRWAPGVLVALLPQTGETSTVVAGRLEGTLRQAGDAVGVALRPVARTLWYPEHGLRAQELASRLDREPDSGIMVNP